MQIGEILRYVRLKKKLNLLDVCEGVNNEIVFSQLSKTERGKQESSFKLIRLVAGFLGIPLDCLDGRVINIAHLEALLSAANNPAELIPLLTWDDLRADPCALSSNAAEPVFVRPPEGVDGGCFAIMVCSDEMESFGGGLSFPIGTTLYVDPQRAWAKDDFVIAFTGTVVTFKQAKRGETGTILRPLNPQYPILPMDSRGVIIGVVIATSQSLL